METFTTNVGDYLENNATNHQRRHGMNDAPKCKEKWQTTRGAHNSINSGNYGGSWWGITTTESISGENIADVGEDVMKLKNVDKTRGPEKRNYN